MSQSSFEMWKALKFCQVGNSMKEISHKTEAKNLVCKLIYIITFKKRGFTFLCVKLIVTWMKNTIV